MDFVLYSVVMTTTSLNVMLAMFLFLGAFASVRINIGFIYMMELLPLNYRSAFGSAWGIYDAVILLIIPFAIMKNQQSGLFYFTLTGYAT